MSKNLSGIVKAVICILLVASAASFVMNLDFGNLKIFNGSKGFFGSFGEKAKETFYWASQYFD